MPENASTNKDRLASITDNIESGIKDLFQSEKYQQYLTTMSRFHRYSRSRRNPYNRHRNRFHRCNRSRNQKKRGTIRGTTSEEVGRNTQQTN